MTDARSSDVMFESSEPTTGSMRRTRALSVVVSATIFSFLFVFVALTLPQSSSAGIDTWILFGLYVFLSLLAILFSRYALRSYRIRKLVVVSEGFSPPFVPESVSTLDALRGKNLRIKPSDIQAVRMHSEDTRLVGITFRLQDGSSVGIWSDDSGNDALRFMTSWCRRNGIKEEDPQSQVSPRGIVDS